MDNFQLMDDYLKGDLPSKEVSAFNKRLKNDPQFEAEFREMKAMQDAAKESAKISTMAKLQQIEMSIANQETTKIEYSMKKLVSVAASLILIATVSYFTVFSTPDVATGQEIYDEYYVTYPNRITGVQRGGEALDIDQLKLDAYNAYDSKDFTSAKNLFAQLLKQEESAANYLYAGIANLEFGDLESAKTNLSTVVNDFAELEAQSKWFMAMTLLKENTEESVDEALSSLAELIIDETSYTSDAKEILKKMGMELMTDTSEGTVTTVENNPNTNGDSPEGSLDAPKRKFQWGVIRGFDNSRYAFFTDDPIEGLAPGDQVVFYVFKKKKRRGMGRAFIIDKR